MGLSTHTDAGRAGRRRRTSNLCDAPATSSPRANLVLTAPSPRALAPAPLLVGHPETALQGDRHHCPPHQDPRHRWCRHEDPGSGCPVGSPRPCPCWHAYRPHVRPCFRHVTRSHMEADSLSCADCSEDVTPVPTDSTRRKGGRRGRRLVSLTPVPSTVVDRCRKLTLMISLLTVSVSLRAATSSSVLSSPLCPSFPFVAHVLFRVRPRPSSSFGRSFSRSRLLPVRIRSDLFLPTPLYSVSDSRAVPSFLRSVEIGKTAQRSPATPTSTSFVDECRGRRCAVPPLPPTLSAVISAGQSRFGAQEGGQEFRGAFVAWRQTVDAIEGLCTEMDAAVKGGGFCMGRLSQSSRVRFPDRRVLQSAAFFERQILFRFRHQVEERVSVPYDHGQGRRIGCRRGVWAAHAERIRSDRSSRRRPLHRS
jgi:hypothetical protein